MVKDLEEIRLGQGEGSTDYFEDKVSGKGK